VPREIKETDNKETDNKETDNREVPELKKEDKPEENYINDIVKKQMEAFQETLINQFREEFNNEVNKFEEDKKEFQSVKQKHRIKELLLENNLESEFLEFVYDDDIEVASMKIKGLNTIITNRVEYVVKERLKLNSYTPPSGDSTGSISNKKPPYMV